MVPLSAPPGAYTFQALAQYDNATDTSFDNFQVVTNVTKPSIVIKRVDVPFILSHENNSIKVVLENMENREIDLNATMMLPYGFVPDNITKLISLQPLSEDIVEFTSVSGDPGSFTGYIRLDYEGNSIINDFDIDVYSSQMFVNNYLKSYWWLAEVVLFALLAVFVYKTRRRFVRRRVEYVYKRKDLLQ